MVLQRLLDSLRRLQISCEAKYFSRCKGYEAWILLSSPNGVGFSWWSLAVGKNCDVVPFEGIGDHRSEICRKYFIRGVVGIEYAVKMEKLFAEAILKCAFIDDLPVSFVLRKLHFRFWEGLKSHWNVNVIVQDAALVQRHEYLRLGPVCFHNQLIFSFFFFAIKKNEYRF